MEIMDFDRTTCSAFVVETVLPLLGKGDRIPEQMPSHHFAWRLGNWLETFCEPIQLVSDSSCDWHLINGYCHAEFSTFPVKIQGQSWVRSDQIEIQQALDEFEAVFNPGMIHHGLYDARRLKLIAEQQKRLLTI